MTNITEAGLIIKMQQLVIEHLEEGNSINETITIIQKRGATWRKRAEHLLKEIELNEAWLHAEREQREVNHEEVLQDALKVIELNIEEITKIIEEN